MKLVKSFFFSIQIQRILFQFAIERKLTTFKSDKVNYFKNKLPIKLVLDYLSLPKMSLALNSLNSGIPVIGRYSLFADLNHA